MWMSDGVLDTLLGGRTATVRRLRSLSASSAFVVFAVGRKGWVYLDYFNRVLYYMRLIRHYISMRNSIS